MSSLFQKKNGLKLDQTLSSSSAYSHTAPTDKEYVNQQSQKIKEQIHVLDVVLYN